MGGDLSRVRVTEEGLEDRVIQSWFHPQVSRRKGFPMDVHWWVLGHISWDGVKWVVLGVISIVKFDCMYQ